jgi:hypothetical protein
MKRCTGGREGVHESVCAFTTKRCAGGRHKLMARLAPRLELARLPPGPEHWRALFLNLYI